MIRPLTEADIETILDIVNDGAQAYQGVIPADCWHEPYMPRQELMAELADGVRFWGFEDDAKVLGVMGRQELQGVTLIRHAYVATAHQRRGIGAQLLAYLCRDAAQPQLVGTWAAAWWAVQFYQRHGFTLVTPTEKNRLLRTYWSISDRQVETSVVLADQQWLKQNQPPG